MNTPTHAALNFLLLARRRDGPRTLVVLGAVLPDVPIFLFFGYQTFVLGRPQHEIWSEVYFRPAWQSVFDAFHSLLLFAAVGAFFAWRKSRAGLLFAASLVLHSLVDWPTHLEDAHSYFWPIWRRPMHGVISYWHPGSPMWMVEIAILAVAASRLVAERLVARRRPTC